MERPVFLMIAVSESGEEKEEVGKVVSEKDSGPCRISVFLGRRGDNNHRVSLT